MMSNNDDLFRLMNTSQDNSKIGEGQEYPSPIIFIFIYQV
jgi:hypothetical protein